MTFCCFLSVCGVSPFWGALGGSGRFWEALEDREGGGSRWLVGRLWEALEDREGVDLPKAFQRASEIHTPPGPLEPPRTSQSFPEHPREGDTTNGQKTTKSHHVLIRFSCWPKRLIFCTFCITRASESLPNTSEQTGRWATVAVIFLPFARRLCPAWWCASLKASPSGRTVRGRCCACNKTDMLRWWCWRGQGVRGLWPGRPRWPGARLRLRFCHSARLTCQGPFRSAL